MNHKLSIAKIFRSAIVAVLSAGLTASAAPTLVVVSFDGFRWDYVDHIHTPHFDRLAARGLRVRSMTPTFPSLTFPNHYTLVTGLESAGHGLVGNRFYDREFGSRYDKAFVETVTDPRWYRGKPVWEIADEHGLRTAAYFWVGSETRGATPDHFFVFDRDVTSEERLEQFRRWMPPGPSAFGDPVPDLILLYFSLVDSAGHRFGPGSPQVVEAVRRADGYLGRILDTIDAASRDAHLLVVADHGMAPMTGETVLVSSVRERVVAAVGEEQIEQLVNNHSQIDIFLKSPTPRSIAAVMERLPQRPWLSWKTREEAFRPVDPMRSGDIIGYAEPGFEFSRSRAGWKVAGAHGYDENLPDMGAICMVMGPRIPAGSRLDRVRSVDILPLCLELLEIPQVEVDGSFDPWRLVVTPVKAAKDARSAP